MALEDIPEGAFVCELTGQYVGIPEYIDVSEPSPPPSQNTPFSGQNGSVQNGSSTVQNRSLAVAVGGGGEGVVTRGSPSLDSFSASVDNRIIPIHLWEDASLIRPSSVSNGLKSNLLSNNTTSVSISSSYGHGKSSGSSSGRYGNGSKSGSGSNSHGNISGSSSSSSSSSTNGYSIQQNSTSTLPSTESTSVNNNSISLQPQSQSMSTSSSSSSSLPSPASSSSQSQSHLKSASTSRLTKTVSVVSDQGLSGSTTEEVLMAGTESGIYGFTDPDFICTQDTVTDFDKSSQRSQPTKPSQPTENIGGSGSDIVGGRDLGSQILEINDVSTEVNNVPIVLCLDCNSFGNIARFIRHNKMYSLKSKKIIVQDQKGRTTTHTTAMAVGATDNRPMLLRRLIYTDATRRDYPKLALFAARKILKNTEIFL